MGNGISFDTLEVILDSRSVSHSRAATCQPQAAGMGSSDSKPEEPPEVSQATPTDAEGQACGPKVGKSGKKICCSCPDTKAVSRRSQFVEQSIQQVQCVACRLTQLLDVCREGVGRLPCVQSSQVMVPTSRASLRSQGEAIPFLFLCQYLHVTFVQVQDCKFSRKPYPTQLPLKPFRHRRKSSCRV